MDCDWDFQLKNPGLANSELTNGVARTGQRALLYATGMDEEDMKKPFVAVINSFSEMVPGHMHMRELAEQVKYGILEGGGIPRETGTIAICDGLCQGHCGMRYPLPSRDLIADSIEMVVQAHHFDAMVAATRSYPACSWPPPGWTSPPWWSPAAPCCPATWAATLCFAPVSCGNSPAGWSRGAVPWKR